MDDKFKHFDYPAWSEEECAVFDIVPEPKQTPLTEEVLTKLWGGFPDDMTRQQAMSFARAIEGAHEIGEKE